MAWVAVTERLPEPGVQVVVFGDCTPESVPLPRASVNEAERARSFGLWSSSEWRGTVAIRFWWEE